MRRSQTVARKEIRMKTFRNLFTNPWFVLAILLYIGSLFVLSRRSEFSISEALIELVIFGLAFPLLAWLATIRARPLTIRVDPSGPKCSLSSRMLSLFPFISHLGCKRLIHGCRKIGSLLT